MKPLSPNPGAAAKKRKALFVSSNKLGSIRYATKNKPPASLYQSSVSSKCSHINLAAHLHTLELLGRITTDWITSLLQCLEAINRCSYLQVETARLRVSLRAIGSMDNAWLKKLLLGGHGQKNVYTVHMYILYCHIVYKWAVYAQVQNK